MFDSHVSRTQTALSPWQRFNMRHQLTWTGARFILAGLGFLGCLAGCGGKDNGLHRVYGTVTLDNAKIKEGSITFVPQAGTKGPSGGSPIADGAYDVPKDKGLAPGKYRVEIRSSRKTGKKIEVGSPTPPGTMMDEVVEAVAPKFNSRSTLEAEIPPKKQPLDFSVSEK